MRGGASKQRSMLRRVQYTLIILPVLHQAGSRSLHPIGGQNQRKAAQSPAWVCGAGALSDDGSADERKKL